MPLVSLRPPLGQAGRLIAFVQKGRVLSYRHAAQPTTYRHSHIRYYSTQTVTPSTSALPSTSPPSRTPAASLLTALLAQPPPSPLPSSLLSSASLLPAELRLLHRSLPLFVGFSSQLPLAGSHFTVECGGVSVVVVRGEDRLIRGLFNNCTHQNARICSSSRPDLALHSLVAATAPTTSSTNPPLQAGPTCHYATRLVCPFHHWTFGLDGQHLAPRTPLTKDPEQRKAFALRRATVDEIDGVLWLTMKVTTAAEATEQVAAEVADGRRAVQQRLVRSHHSSRGSLLLRHNWKNVLATLSQQPDTRTVFPSALYTPHPTPLLLQLLPLTEQLTAVTAYSVGQEEEETGTATSRVAASGRADGEEEEEEEEEWRVWVEGVVSGGGARYESWLEGEYGVLYRRLMVQGLKAEVAVEDQQRKEVEARRNKLLGTQ